jgi:hypothetical protein
VALTCSHKQKGHCGWSTGSMHGTGNKEKVGERQSPAPSELSKGAEFLI